ncbi:hypothetical protein AWB81_07114 [Caballeronia arationis]|jgi:hypothetical protein|uniref:Uncharacterized protein n=1 Tax=Caballeronia arationis TaxID=1777142 RepID=A0A7Z7I7E5_9BURK|nr:hypothetical protein AWB81_07114 [Caballeronia arationis]SOE80659.1 hypothetical protein SAMN05446927_3901 [Caballeronia arationis]
MTVAKGSQILDSTPIKKLVATICGMEFVKAGKQAKS